MSGVENATKTKTDIKYDEFYDEYVPYNPKTGRIIYKRQDVIYGPFEQITDLKFTKKGVKAETKRTKCPECGYKIKYTDLHHKETVCEYCGVVLDKHALVADSKYIITQTSEDLPENDDLYKKEEKQLLSKMHRKSYNKHKAHKKRYNTSSREYRLTKQYLFVNEAGKELNMLKTEIRKVKKIISKHTIKKIHRGLAYEIVITGICLYILRDKGYLIPYRHEFVRKVGLNKIQYNVIKRKLDELQVLENL